MPYKIEGNCVKKADTGETIPGGCHKNHEEALAHLRALEANVKNSDVVEMSMRIFKASYNKSEKSAMKWEAIDSDTGEDLYAERMSKELYMDFCSRIENNTPVPEQFKSVICETDWCGGVPYLSIAHYKAGSGMKNVPGMVKSVFVDGVRLKSKGTLHDTDMGRKVWDALREDLYMEKSGNSEHTPVRISIGFLDLEHKHLAPSGGQEFTFTRTDLGQICPLCAQGIGGKIYMKGQLVHLAMTRVPVNPRTRMMTEKSMDEITTKRDDAKSIIGELADELEEKSIANDVLVVRAEDGSAPKDDANMLEPCYDPNTDSYNQECVNGIMDKFMPKIRDEVGQPVKSASTAKLRDVVMTYINKTLPVEDAMETVQKMVAGGESVPEKPFKFTQDGVTVTGDGNNTIANPVKAKADDESPEEDKKGDEKEMDKHMKKEMSALDQSYESLKSILANAQSVEDVQKAFNEFGSEVEKAYTPEQPKAVDTANLAEIVRSAVEQAVAPLKVEIATLKAAQGNTVSTPSVTKSKALTINQFTRPEQIIQKSENQPKRDPNDNVPMQIRSIARKSTGLPQ